MTKSYREPKHRIEIHRKATRVGTSEVCVSTHVSLRMFIIMQVRASQLHFLANRNAELAVPPLFWLVNCIKIGGHVALLPRGRIIWGAGNMECGGMVPSSWHNVNCRRSRKIYLTQWNIFNIYLTPIIFRLY